MARWNVLGAGLLAVFFSTVATANWPALPDTNLLICGRGGEQTLPKICATSDGGCYVCWQDNVAGNYDLYLQRLNALGEPLWGACGMLVDGHPQETWITDYDMTVDSTDHAIIVINDIRAGGDWDIYAYRISPTGTFVWGADGLTISDNEGFEPDPRVIVTSGRNIVIAWQEETTTSNVVNVRKITPAGADVWNPAVRTISGDSGMTVPRIAAAENDAVIVQYLKNYSTQLWSLRHIYAQKFDSSGSPMWPDTGIVISNAGGLGPQMEPDLKSDGSGGAYSFWYDARNNVDHHVFAQHVLASGAMAWTANGVQVSTTATEMQMYPSLAHIPGSSNIALFYVVTDMPQSQNGVGGQLLDMNGARLWGAGGQNVVSLSLLQRLNVRVLPQGINFTVLYLEYIDQTLDSIWLKALSVNVSGQTVWTPSVAILSNVNAPKGHMEATVNPLGQIIAAWRDHRTDALGDLYLQNVNFDGTLGDPGAPRPRLSILFPADDDTTAYLPLYMMVLVEHFDLAPAPNGDGEIEVRVNGAVESWLTDPITAQANQLQYGMNTVVLELVTHNHQPLPMRAMDSIHVAYLPNGAEPPSESIAREFSLSAPHPNPFNPSTTLRFSLPHDGNVSLSLFDVLGREVLPLISGWRQAGTHEIVVDASSLPGGLYFCRFAAGRFSAVQKLVLLK